MEVNFNSYQQKTGETAIYMDKVMEHYPDIPVGVQRMIALSYVAMGLGEAGEVQGKIKKLIRDIGTGEVPLSTRAALGKELGDLLYYVAQAAQLLGFTLEDIAVGNLENLAGRKERGTLTGSGDNR